MGKKSRGEKIRWLRMVSGGIIAGLILMAAAPGFCAKAADDEISASYGVSFDKNSTWDLDDDGWDLNITTDEVPEQGITLVMNVLIPASDGEKPFFEGRFRVLAVLLLGSSQKWVQSNAVAELVSDDFSEIVTVDGKTYDRATMSVSFSETVGTEVNGQWDDFVPYSQAVDQPVSNVRILFLGRRCDYAGEIAIQNPYFTYDQNSVRDSYSVNSTIGRCDETSLFLLGTTLITESGDCSSAEWSQVKLADQQAAPAAAKAYAYLKAVGATDHVIFGMQNELWSKSGTAPDSRNGLTGSDVEDITGSNAGIIGMDTLSLTGAEFSAVKYNSGFAMRNGLPVIDIDGLGAAAANVKAAAEAANLAISRGALVTLSSHMPNFVQVSETSGYRPERDPSYAKYDFAGSSAWDQDNDCALQILPEGACNEKFNAYLDMIADYAGQVNGPILFRPFHEGTGGWFWWGAADCDAAVYRRLFRYTVEYLRDTKQIHNLIYVYSTNGDSMQGSAAAYEERYPGDNYVDVIGFDMYYMDSGEDSGPWFSRFEAEVSAAKQFAAQHDKIFAVTETGTMRMVPAAGDVATALSRSGNSEKQWFEKVLNVLSDSGACYFLTWSNNEEMSHVPYIKAVNDDGSLYGHEMTDGFMDFFNDRRSVFAVNQREILKFFS